MAANKKSGDINLPNNLNPEPHEISTANFLAKHGKNIEFLVPNRSRHSKTPDITFDGKRWEVKSPTGNSKTTISNSLKRAVKQSSYIVLDARRTKLADELIISEIQRNIKLTRSIKEVLLITKSRELVVIRR